MTESVIDTDYGITENSYTDYTVKGIITPTYIEEVRWIPPGFIEVGDARGFLHPTYDIDGIVVTPERGDRLLGEDGTVYQIDDKRHWKHFGIEYLECRLRRMME
jgi:hypothetical protein